MFGPKYRATFRSVEMNPITAGAAFGSGCQRIMPEGAEPTGVCTTRATWMMTLGVAPGCVSATRSTPPSQLIHLETLFTHHLQEHLATTSRADIDRTPESSLT